MPEDLRSGLMADFINLAGDQRGIVVHKKYPLFVLISEDTIHRHIKDYESSLKEHYEHWYSMIGSFSIALSCVTALVTVEKWQDFVLSGAVWHAIFIVVAAASVVNGLKAGCFYYRRGSLATVDSIVKQITDENVYDDVQKEPSLKVKSQEF